GFDEALPAANSAIWHRVLANRHPAAAPSLTVMQICLIPMLANSLNIGRICASGGGSLAPPQQTTANEEQCRCPKALVRNTVAMFSRLRVGGPASRNSGKIRDGQDGGRNLSTWASFHGPTPNLQTVWL